MASEAPNNVGFGRSDGQSFVIPSGSTGADQPRVDLGRPYAFILITCANMAGVASGNLKLNASPEENIPLHAVYEQNNAGTVWSSGALPTSGTFYMLCTHAFGARFVQLELTVAADADLTFKIWGYDPALVGQPDR